MSEQNSKLSELNIEHLYDLLQDRTKKYYNSSLRWFHYNCINGK